MSLESALRSIASYTKLFAVMMILVGVGALVLKHKYHGPFEPLVASHLGNVSASFAIFFLASIPIHQAGLNPIFAAVAALTVVESFELFDGFGVMSNTYDPWDYLANGLGVGMAYGLVRIIGSAKSKEVRIE